MAQSASITDITVTLNSLCAAAKAGRHEDYCEWLNVAWSQQITCAQVHDAWLHAQPHRLDNGPWYDFVGRSSKGECCNPSDAADRYEALRALELAAHRDDATRYTECLHRAEALCIADDLIAHAHKTGTRTFRPSFDAHGNPLHR